MPHSALPHSEIQPSEFSIQNCHVAFIPDFSMRTFSILIAFLTALVQTPSTQPPSSLSYKIVGYYADWTAERYPLADIPAEQLTHVNYAFGKIGADSQLTFNRAIALDRVYPRDCSEPQCPHGLFNQITLIKERYPHLKFLMSVGGWTDSGPFYEM